MKSLCDLHVHSTFSDGTLRPAQLVALAEKTGLQAVALCDHNTVAGLPEFLDAARGSAVESVPGIEISADYRGGEVHILGLFISPAHYGAAGALLAEPLEKKERSNIAFCQALTEAGLPLDYGRIKAATPGGQVNRAVIAAEMARLGYCADVPAAFSQWLSPKRGFYLPPERLDAFRVIRFIRSIGAVAVLAHPFLNLSEPALREFLSEAAEAGLTAMETRYPKFTPEQTALACRIAREYGLLESGGSDFHGANKPEIPLGAVQVPLEFLEKLRL